MLEAALVALAASGGTAVVQAAGTDAWAGVRQAVARWFGRGDEGRQQAELERLDETAVALESQDRGDDERTRMRHEALWQARIETVLEDLRGQERERAVQELKALFAAQADGAGTSAGPGGLAARTVSVHAEGQSIAAAVVHGGATIGHTPTVPDPSQG